VSGLSAELAGLRANIPPSSSHPPSEEPPAERVPIPPRPQELHAQVEELTEALRRKEVALKDATACLEGLEAEVAALRAAASMPVVKNAEEGGRVEHLEAELQGELEARAGDLDRIQELEEKLRAAETPSELGTGVEKVASLEDEVSTYAAKVRALNEEVEQLREEVQDQAAQLSDKDRILEAMQDETQEAQDDLANTQGQVVALEALQQERDHFRSRIPNPETRIPDPGSRNPRILSRSNLMIKFLPGSTSGRRQRGSRRRPRRSKCSSRPRAPRR